MTTPATKACPYCSETILETVNLFLGGAIGVACVAGAGCAALGRGELFVRGAH